MLVPWDLGFRGFVLVVFFFFCPIFSFVIRRKWRISVARKQEIMRLVAMASEEAARAELEATSEYGAVSVARQFQCVLCYCPTTTRCSRCKAVRYCSGKCQIIHWRQGHKEECHPPSTTAQFNDPGCNFDQKASLQEQQEFNGNDLEIGCRRNAKPIETFPEEPVSSKSNCSPECLSGKDDDKDGLFLDTKGPDISSESPSGLPTSSITEESLVDVSVSEGPVSNTPKRLEDPLSDDVTLNELETTVDVNDSGLTESPHPEFTSLGPSVNSFSCSSKLKQTTSSSSAGVVDCGSTSASGSRNFGYNESKILGTSTIHSDFWDGTLGSIGENYVHDDSKSIFLQGAVNNLHSQSAKSKNLISDGADPVFLGNKKPVYGASLPEKIVSDASLVKSSTTLSFERSADADNDKSSNSQLLKPEAIRSVSSNVSNDCPSSIEGGRSVPNVNSSKVDSVHIERSGFSEVANSPNSNNGLKTSVQKVVQQFKVSKLTNPLGFGTDSAEKYNCKMLFPYDVFIKLYHWNKEELHPCGLTNCGNSCYANAVLQCLIFTRPLTAYLLQGLHSKACSEKDWCFTCEFEGLILKAKEGKSPVSPLRIMSQLQHIGSHLGHGKEEDAHEFFRCAIDTMQSVCLKEAGVNAVVPLAEETTLIGLIFGGYLQSKIKCMKCRGKSERHERMMDLAVEIEGDIGTLEEALQRFTATEILDGENKYQCCRCKSYEKAKKKLMVLEAPNVLTIALKRFQSGKFGKLTKTVKFPEILNLAPYMSGTSDKSPIYRLYAVVVHLDILNAAFSGHYVCYVRNIQGKWFQIDDSTVTPVELERVLSKGAYMLLYARCSPRAPSSIRNAMISNDGKIKRGSRCSEAFPSGHNGKSTTSKAWPISTPIPSADPSTAQRKLEDYPYWVTSNVPASYESPDLFDGRLHLWHRIPKAESSSDNSSLLSCSDEGSCTTESTRDSSSTDDFSDYFFGEAGRGWNSPLRDAEDLDGPSSSPLFSRSSLLAASDRYVSGTPEISGYRTCKVDPAVEAHVCRKRLPKDNNSRRESLEDKRSLHLLYSDATKHCRKLASYSCSSNSNSSSSSNSSRETDLEQLDKCKPLDVKSGISMRRCSKERTDKTFY